jgi:uncharacterized protein (DUF2147 family)
VAALVKAGLVEARKQRVRDGAARRRSVLGAGARAALLIAWSAVAQAGEPAGLWQEYDDKTGKVEALIRVEQAADGTYQGTIVKLVAEVVGSASRVCSGCGGSLHNQPLLGMRILTGMRRKDAHTFEGGEIVDPDDGKVYRCRMRLSEDGRTLEVTGYIGVSWLGESEIWRRAE